MKRVLLTGGTGFVGRHCVPRLVESGWETHCVTSVPSSPPAELDGAVWHRANLLDPAQLTELVRNVRPTALLHLAWYAKPGAFWTANENFDWLAASIHLVREFVAAGGQRFVGVGTCAEYDWSGGICDEATTPCRPSTLYGASKAALNVVAEAVTRGANVSSAWARLFFLYGPHENEQRLVPSVVRALLRGQPARCTSGEQIRDFLHVADAAAALTALLESDVQGSVNVGSGSPVAIRDVATSIARQMGAEQLLALGALPDRGGEPPLITATTARLDQEVGWRPVHTLASGLSDTIKWWQSRKTMEGDAS